MNDSTPLPNILTLPETAQYLRVHPTTVYRMLKSGKLPAFKVGTDWRFYRHSIDAWISTQEANHRNGSH